MLCGARSPRTVADLRRAAGAEGAAITAQSQTSLSPYAPARVEVKADSDERIRATAGRMGIPYLDQPPARSMAHVSASLEEYCRNLSWSAGEDLNWQREDFSVRSLRFQAALGKRLLVRGLADIKIPLLLSGGIASGAMDNSQN